MPSQFFGLNIAYTGLLASNAALNTTGNNIANIETEGYSRQQVNQSASEALRTFTTYGCAGAGVDVLSIERIRDNFYDNKYWTSVTSAGEYNMKQYYMRQIEDYFADDSTTEGFTSVFNKMMDALAEVKKQSGADTTKAQFIGFADNLTEYFNNMSGNLEQVQKDVNAELKLKIDEINSISSEIATLNKQINVIEMSGSVANELRDQRTLLLDQLSAIVNIETSETPITDSNDPTRETGGSRFLVKIAGGQVLVDANEYKTMACIARTKDEKVNQSDIDGLYEVYWVSNQLTGALGDKFNIYNESLGGELQGLVEMRDGNNGENFRGTVTEVGNDPAGGLDANGNPLKTVTIKVTEDYLLDLNKTKLSNNGGIITLANQDFYYTDWTYQYNEVTKETTYTFIIDESMNGEKLTPNKKGKEANINAAVKYQGVPYFMSQMNEWARIFSTSFNDILKSGFDAYGNAGNILFTGDMETDDDQLLFTDRYNTTYADGTRKSETINSKDDSYYRLTAKNFNVLESLTFDADLLATKTDSTAGSDQYDNVTNMIDMVYDKREASFRGAATGEFLTCLLSDIALNANSANTFYINFDNVSKTINNQRVSISGVDNDEEAVNLVKYQNAYTLASKTIQTLTEVYDRLILQTGV